ncbi:hypothetical protein JCM11641_002562 [Rhodosporidiobolus odoratus]
MSGFASGFSTFVTTLKGKSKEESEDEEEVSDCESFVCTGAARIEQRHQWKLDAVAKRREREANAKLEEERQKAAAPAAKPAENGRRLKDLKLLAGRRTPAPPPPILVLPESHGDSPSKWLRKPSPAPLPKSPSKLAFMRPLKLGRNASSTSTSSMDTAGSPSTSPASSPATTPSSSPVFSTFGSDDESSRKPSKAHFFHSLASRFPSSATSTPATTPSTTPVIPTFGALPPPPPRVNASTVPAPQASLTTGRRRAPTIALLPTTVPSRPDVVPPFHALPPSPPRVNIPTGDRPLSSLAPSSTPTPSFSPVTPAFGALPPPPSRIDLPAVDDQYLNKDYYNSLFKLGQRFKGDVLVFFRPGPGADASQVPPTLEGPPLTSFPKPTISRAPSFSGAIPIARPVDAFPSSPFTSSLSVSTFDLSPYTSNSPDVSLSASPSNGDISLGGVDDDGIPSFSFDAYYSTSPSDLSLFCPPLSPPPPPPTLPPSSPPTAWTSTSTLRASYVARPVSSILNYLRSPSPAPAPALASVPTSPTVDDDYDHFHSQYLKDVPEIVRPREQAEAEEVRPDLGFAGAAAAVGEMWTGWRSSWVGMAR